MPYEADILRGVRVAVVTFALLLCGIIGYRISSDAAPEPEVAKPAAKRVPASSVAKQPVQSLASTSAVPSPPPIHRIVKKRTTAPPPARFTIATAPPANQTTASIAPESKPATAALSPLKPSPIEEIVLPAPPPAAQPVVAPVVSQAPVEVASPGRARRWVKAVGRVFHIGGKKDVTPETLRVPEAGQSAESVKPGETAHP